MDKTSNHFLLFWDHLAFRDIFELMYRLHQLSILLIYGAVHNLDADKISLEDALQEERRLNSIVMIRSLEIILGTVECV